MLVRMPSLHLTRISKEPKEYRRIVFCCTAGFQPAEVYPGQAISNTTHIYILTSADYKSAVQQIENLRYDFIGLIVPKYVQDAVTSALYPRASALFRYSRLAFTGRGITL